MAEFFPPPPLFEAPLGGNPSNIAMKFDIRKLESDVTRWWRNHDASILLFDTIPACDGRMERQTRCSCKDPH